MCISIGLDVKNAHVHVLYMYMIKCTWLQVHVIYVHEYILYTPNKDWNLINTDRHIDTRTDTHTHTQTHTDRHTQIDT